MAHRQLKEQALKLRIQGKSYSQIKNEIKVSKSTLSNWLRNLPLSQEQLEKVSYKNEARIEKFRATMLKKWQVRQEKIYNFEKEQLLPLAERELYLAGLFLYWGEGGKTSKSMLTISNTDPKVMQFAVYWLVKCLKVNKKNIAVKMHLYQDMNEEDITKFWVKKLKIQRSQFRKPYVKKTKSVDLTMKGFGFGTCNLEIGDVNLKQKIMMGIKAIAQYYAELI